MLQLVLDGQDANLAAGDGTVVVHSGGEIEVPVNGTFGGATVTLYARFTGLTDWVPIDGGTWTESSVKLLRTARPCDLSFGVASASGTTDIDAWM